VFSIEVSVAVDATRLSVLTMPTPLIIAGLAEKLMVPSK
jgi:hypothetical protein